ncbi:fructose-1-phosphatase [Salmonella enterica subsp. enterica serovar Bovismorbificans]|nr:fructose-1-phosphatase [Salmonella enterica subsp. enterica serovar Bovismorbificans]
MPTQCVVFEDADFGLQAARAAGMDAVDVRLL